MLPGVHEPREYLDSLHGAVHLLPAPAGEALLGEESSCQAGQSGGHQQVAQLTVGTEEGVSDHPGAPGGDTDVIHLTLGRHVGIQAAIDQPRTAEHHREIASLVFVNCGGT